MKTLLVIHTSLQGSESLSSSLASDYLAQWQANNPDGQVFSRDLASEPVPHLTAERFAAFTSAADQGTAMGDESLNASIQSTRQQIRALDTIAA